MNEGVYVDLTDVLVSGNKVRATDDDAHTEADREEGRNKPES